MKYLTIVIGLFFFVGCFKEKTKINQVKNISFVKAERKPTIIDSLITEQEIQEFVQKLNYPYYRFKDRNDSIKTYKTLEKFELKKIKEFDRSYKEDIDSITKIIADSLKITESYYKSDIDNNGFLDMVIIGDSKCCSSFTALEPNSTRSSDYSVYALMNFGNDSINPVNLKRLSLILYSIIPKIEYLKDKPQLTIFEPPQFSWPDNEKISNLKKIELAYKFGTFVEYNTNPKKYSIESIEYKTEGCYGNCPVFKLIMCNDQTATLSAVEFNSLEPNLFEYSISRELKGEFETIIDIKNYKDIIDLLNYLDFPSLENDYYFSATDQPSSQLTIMYDNGKTKIISDYGKKGTHGLVKIYNMISNLRTNQKWNKITEN